jgi:predicted DNA-binding protein (MmcQ/YjbR family)
MSLVVKRYKRLVKELLFAHSELEYVKEVLKEAHSEFESFYQDYCRKKNIPIDELNKNNSEKLEKVYPSNKPKVDEEGIVQYETDDTDKENHKIFQRMYRMVAKKLHPDKFSNLDQTPEVIEKIESFKQATGAYNKKNWAEFLDICEKYDILPTRYEKINSLIRDEISEIGKEVNNKKLSFSWRLYECEDDVECKDKVIKDFLYQLFKYKS